MPKAKAHPAAPKTTKAPSIRFFIADDVRLEQNGKVTAVGLYTDSVVVFLMGKGQPDPTRKRPVALNSLAFLVTLSGLAGTKKISFTYADPAIPAPKAPEVREITFSHRGQSANLVGRFQPLVASSFGKKHLTMLIDDRSYPLEFEVRRAEGPDAILRQAPAESEPAPAMKRIKAPTAAKRSS